MSLKDRRYIPALKYFKKEEKKIYRNFLISKIKKKAREKERRFNVDLFTFKMNKHPKLPISLGRRCHNYQSGVYTVGKCRCVTQQEFNQLKRTKYYSGAIKRKEQQCEE